VTIYFWGVRGSIPAPLTPQQIQAKIAAVVQRISPKDIESEDARECFISSLPKWLFGTIGGNTPCIEITGAQNEKIILDAGSGLRVLGKLGLPPADLHYHILLSHFHWDHIQGLPFFDPAYNQKAVLDFYSPFPALERILAEQMRRPYYPVDFTTLTKNKFFHQVFQNKSFSIGSITIQCLKMTHPGNSYAYALSESEHKFVYATDVELSTADFERTQAHVSFFENADVLVLDSQYTVEEAFQKENWGHSAFCYAIDFAMAWKIKKLYLFHHEPTYDDRKINSILESAKWYASYITHDTVQVFLAVEGHEIHL
jgi:phosphoribosyl 1,2-cyclic phosphodiesterase